ncbi:MAG TPA: hypothetical protein VLZ53_10855, partial [Devosia sp.]|nr:hypothetical protein [Devosia sp.]
AIAALPPAIVSSVPPAASPAPDRSELEGIYANYEAPFQVLAESDGSLTLNRWNVALAQWAPVQTQLRARSDGQWWSDGQATVCYRFQTVAGHRYLIQRNLTTDPLYWDERPQGEWLAPIAMPQAWRDRVGGQWLCINQSPDSVEGRMGKAILRISELKELPGYLWLNNEQLLRSLNDDEASMSVQVPLNNGRDLVELRLVTTDGKEALHSGSLVFERITA